MISPPRIAGLDTLWDAPSVYVLAWLAIATLLPVFAVVGAVRAPWSRGNRSRRVALVLAAVALVYFHPIAQESLNARYLGPKLERARALAGQDIGRLFAQLGEPARVVPDPSPGPREYGYVLYGAAPWTPLATGQLLVPISDDGKRVSVFAHFVD